MVYSNSVRTGPRLRLLSAIVATSFAMRTLALLPLLFAISPSRILTLRMTAVFQPSLATKNLRSISRVMTKILSFRLRDTHTAAPPPSGARQPSGGRTTQNSTPLFKPSCLGAQTCAPPSGAAPLIQRDTESAAEQRDEL